MGPTFADHVPPHISHDEPLILLDPTRPRPRLFEVLAAQRMQMDQQITYWSDDGDTVRHLQLYLSPQAEHLSTANWVLCSQALVP
jgi:hypothetical protein